VDSNRGDLPVPLLLFMEAEEMAWGCEGIAPDPEEALRLFKQSADLGLTDALIRIGQFHEQGKGTSPDAYAALKNYLAAANAGNVVALAFVAKLMSRSTQLERSELLWSRFFAKLETIHEHEFLAAGRGELLHDYIVSQLRLGLEPGHIEVLRRHRIEIAGFHQQILEHAGVDGLDRLSGVLKWIELNLGPWPV
jgi:hypothetical protein